MQIVVFGSGQLSSLAWYCLSHDSPHEVVGFTVDQDYLSEPHLHGLPLVPFEDLEAHFPPERCRLLIPLGYRLVNELRAERYRRAKARGYHFASYLSSRASLWPDLKVGENCMIYEQAVVQPFAEIGDNVIIRSGAHVSHHVRIGDHCFIAAHAALGGGVILESNCFIGINATLRDGITVARRCVIGAGAVVTKDTEENGVYIGSPAKRGPTPADQMKRL